MNYKRWQNVNIIDCLRCLPSIPSAIGYLHHMKPSIADAVDTLVKQGVEHIIAIVTAPFFTSLGTGAL